MRVGPRCSHLPPGADMPVVAGSVARAHVLVVNYSRSGLLDARD